MDDNKIKRINYLTNEIVKYQQAEKDLQYVLKTDYKSVACSYVIYDYEEMVSMRARCIDISAEDILTIVKTKLKVLNEELTKEMNK